MCLCVCSLFILHGFGFIYLRLRFVLVVYVSASTVFGYLLLNESIFVVVVVVVIAVVKIQFVMCVRQRRRGRRRFFVCLIHFSQLFIVPFFTSWYFDLQLVPSSLSTVRKFRFFCVCRSFFFECFLNGFCCCVIARHMSLGELKALEFRTESVHYNYNYNVDMKCISTKC